MVKVIKSERFTKWKDAEKASKQVGAKIKCSICGEATRLKDLSFNQWSSREWTAYCEDCQRGSDDEYEM